MPNTHSAVMISIRSTIFTHPYYQKFKLNINQFPNTKIFSNTAVSLPIYNGLNKHQLEYIVRSIKNFFKND